jgi:NAD(P)-dependent dehydrogenase (short-subunit alcohol dehydrogenase family)
VARQLAAAGWNLALAARNADRLQSVASETGAAAFPVDACDSAALANCVEQAVAKLGRLDGYLHAVGSILLKPAHLTTDAEWEDTLRLNLTSSFSGLRSAVRAMSSGGSIVLMSSAAAAHGLPNHEAISAAKAGIEGLVRSAAASYAPRGIRVNAVAPGLTRTPLAAKITANEAALKASTAMHPLGRIGEPEDIARAIAWLLAPEQSWVTGQILRVDGGLSTVRGR